MEMRKWVMGEIPSNHHTLGQPGLQSPGRHRAKHEAAVPPPGAPEWRWKTLRVCARADGKEAGARKWARVSFWPQPGSGISPGTRLPAPTPGPPWTTRRHCYPLSPTQAKPLSCGANPCSPGKSRHPTVSSPLPQDSRSPSKSL